MNAHKENTMNDNHTPDRTDALAVLAALDQLAKHDPDNAATVGRYLEHLESLNHRQLQYATTAGKVLEDSKRDLMRAGWVAAWLTLSNDPDLIHGDPTSAFNITFDALNGETR